jgi:hypothetical protein
MSNKNGETRSEISVPEFTVKRLKELYNVLDEVDKQIKTTCLTILEANGASGNYEISKDKTKLIPVEHINA